MPWPAPMMTKPRPSSRSIAGKSGTGVSSARVTSSPGGRVAGADAHAEEVAGVATEDRGLGVTRQAALDDLREEMTHAPADRPRIEVGSEQHAFGTETHGKLFDEVEVVAQTRIEHDVRCYVRYEEALLRGLVRRECIERQDREVREGSSDRCELPQ